jgi:predicted phage tail protein
LAVHLQSALGFAGVVTCYWVVIAQLISPQQTYSSAERGKDAARFESFTFSGITNTAQQGLPVPIVYGRAYIGSAVISSGLDVDQLI